MNSDLCKFIESKILPGKNVCVNFSEELFEVNSFNNLDRYPVLETRLFFDNILLLFPITYNGINKYTKDYGMVSKGISFKNKKINNIWILDNTSDLVKEWIRTMPIFLEHSFQEMYLPTAKIDDVTLMHWKKR